jgi:hypothetical protein
MRNNYSVQQQQQQQYEGEVVVVTNNYNNDIRVENTKQQLHGKQRIRAATAINYNW